MPFLIRGESGTGKELVARILRDHELGSRRQVFKEHYLYPRMVTDRRGPGYETPGYPKTEPIGSIPQVDHTCSYFDGNCRIVNEHNLMFGECTNAARYQSNPVMAEEAEKTGKHVRLFYSSELSRVALERCMTARQAVRLMGDLIEEYGRYHNKTPRRRARSVAEPRSKGLGVPPRGATRLYNRYVEQSVMWSGLVSTPRAWDHLDCRLRIIRDDLREGDHHERQEESIE